MVPDTDSPEGLFRRGCWDCCGCIADCGASASDSCVSGDCRESAVSSDRVAGCSDCVGCSVPSDAFSRVFTREIIRFDQHFRIRFAWCGGIGLRRVRRRGIRWRGVGYHRGKHCGRFRHFVGFCRHSVGRQRQRRLCRAWGSLRAPPACPLWNAAAVPDRTRLSDRRPESRRQIRPAHVRYGIRPK